MSVRPYYVLRYSGSGTDLWPGARIYLWSPTGQLPSDFSVYHGDAELNPVGPTQYGSYWVVNPYVVAFELTPDAVIGNSYYRRWPDPTSGPYEISINAVNDPAPNNPTIIASGSAQSAIQAAIDAGYSPIYLSPGDYHITTSFDLTGSGVASIVVIDGQNWASLTAGPELGTDLPPYDSNPIFDVTKPLTLKRLSFFGSALNLSQRVLGSTSPQYVDINVSLCRFVDINLGWRYLPEYDPDDGGSDAYGTGIVVERCEFVRAVTGPILTGSVFNYCRFKEMTPSGAHAFYNYTSRKWLVFSCDWVRTARGIVCQSFAGGIVKNGVVAGCRFWDIQHGAQDAGEVILLESTGGQDDSVFSNAFVWSHMFNCSGSGVQLAGSGMHDNYFGFLTLHTMAASILVWGYRAAESGSTLVSNNTFEHIEMGAELTVQGHCADNLFNDVIALRYPLRAGNVQPGLQYLLYGHQGKPSFLDTSTYDAGAGEGPNQYKNLYLSYPEMPLHVVPAPSVTYDVNP